MQTNLYSVFRYSSWDILAVLSCVGYGVGLVLMIQLTVALAGNLIALAAAILGLFITYNLGIHAYHYHQHTPYFRSDRANLILNSFCSAVWSTPMSVYSHQHMLHHNPKLLPTMTTYNDVGKNGTLFHLNLTLKGVLFQLDVFKLLPLVWLLQDKNLSKVHGRTGQHQRPTRAVKFAGMWHRGRGDRMPENLLAIYQSERFFGPPLNFQMTCELAKKTQQARCVISETCSVSAFRIGLFLLNWKAFLVFYLPWEFFVNTIFRNWADYVDHAGAELADDTKNSSSCYSSLFNLLTFNGGYHLEHHHRPGVHWSKLKALTTELPPPETRQVSTWHYLGRLKTSRARPALNSF